jgi:hypothetical protein
MNRIDIIGAVDGRREKAIVIVPLDVDLILTIFVTSLPDASYLPSFFTIRKTAAKALKANNSGVRRRDLRGHDTLAKGLECGPKAFLVGCEVGARHGLASVQRQCRRTDIYSIRSARFRTPSSDNQPDRKSLRVTLEFSSRNSSSRSCHP